MPSNKVRGVTDPLALRILSRAQAQHGAKPSRKTRLNLVLVTIWFAGMRKDVPSALSFLAQEAEQELDPEFEEYLRLKEKFET